MLNKAALLLIFLLTFTVVKAERIVFDMSVFGFRFGEMVLTRTMVNDSIERYTMNAKGKTDFLWMNREEQSSITVEYRNGKLFSSNYEYLNKGTREKWSKIQFDGKKYLVQSHEGRREFTDVPDYSLIKLYFDPNWNRDRVFCEEDCSYSKMIRNAEKNTLDIHCQDGSRSTYHVSNGRVEAMEINFALATVKLTRIN